MAVAVTGAELVATTPSIRRPHRHSTCRDSTRCDSLPFVDTLEIPLIRKYLFYFPIYRKITLLLLLLLPLLLFSSLSMLLLSLVLFYGNCHCFTSVVLFVLPIVTWTLSSRVRGDIVEEGGDTSYTHTHIQAQRCIYLALEKPHWNKKFYLNQNMNTNLKFFTGK